MRYTMQMTAGRPVRFPVTGRTFQLVSTGVAGQVAVIIEMGGDRQTEENLGAVGDKFKFHTDTPFSALNFESTVDTLIDVIVSMYDVSLNPNEGGIEVTVDTTAGPVSVSIDSLPPVEIEHFAATSVSRLAESAASVNATLAANAPRMLHAVTAFNTTGATIYLKLYDKATAPVVGTDVPRLMLPVPAGGGVIFDDKTNFTTGIGFGFTTGAADNNAGAIGAGAIVGFNLTYS